MNKWLFRILRILSAFFISISLSFVFTIFLEMIVDIKFDHEVTGLIYTDGLPGWIFGSLLFLTLIFYIISKRHPIWIKIIRSVLMSGLISYTVVITGLITDIESIGTDNMIAIGVTLFICSLIGILLLELTTFSKRFEYGKTSNRKLKRMKRNQIEE